MVLLEFTFVLNEFLIERADFVLAQIALILGGCLCAASLRLFHVQCAPQQSVHLFTSPVAVFCGVPCPFSTLMIC